MNHETSPVPNPRTPLGLDFPVDNVAMPTLRRLGITTLEELATLDIVAVSSQRGIGVKKLQIFKSLIQRAKTCLAQKSMTGGTGSNEDSSSSLTTMPAQENLIFVPSLLMPIFQREGIETVEDLLNGHALLQNCYGWGERKDALYGALRELYLQYSVQGEAIDVNSRVTAVISPGLLPSPDVGQMSVQQYLDASAVSLHLEGRPMDDFLALKHFFLAHVAEIPLDSNQGEEVAMNWRDIPLVVSKRVAANLKTALYCCRKAI